MACVLSGALESCPEGTGPSLEDLRAAFPQLEILEPIGRGGMGCVYKARQTHLDRLVALKVLSPELSTDPGFTERFSQEARTLAKLSHPNIVGIHDYGQSGDYYYLLMEYVDGVNLRQAMQAARFTPEQALALVPDLCSALQFAHDHHILHRDIKPENILIDTSGRVKIADFGIARLLSTEPSHLTLTATGAALGSAAYMAPEQIENDGETDHRADIYSLGVVFYEMLTGGLPLGRFPLPSEKSPSSTGIDAVVLRALEKERERRYQRADDVRTGLEHADDHPATTFSRRPATQTAAENGQQRFVTWALALVGGGIIAGGVGWLTSPTILGLGYIATIVGVLGSWWILFRMKSGQIETTFRRLLLWLTVVPVIVGIAWSISMIFLVKVDYHSDVGLIRHDTSAFLDVVYSRQPLTLLWMLIPMLVAAAVGRLFWQTVTSSPRSSLAKSFQRFAIVGSSVLAITSFFCGDYLADFLPPFTQVKGFNYQFSSAKGKWIVTEDDNKLLGQAIEDACAEYTSIYRIEFDPSFGPGFPHYPLGLGRGGKPGRISIDFRSVKPGLAEAHAVAFEQRVNALLPPTLSIASSSERISREREMERIQRKGRGPFLMVALLAFIGASTLAPFGSWRGIALIAAIGILMAIFSDFMGPDGPHPILPPSIEGYPPLPELALGEDS